jgi:hypothetical protein
MRKNINTYGILVMKYPEVRDFFENIYVPEDNIKINFSKCVIQGGGMNLSVCGED